MKKVILWSAFVLLACACAIVINAKHASVPKSKPIQGAEVRKTSVVDQGFRTTTRGVERIENTRFTPGVTEVPR